MFLHSIKTDCMICDFQLVYESNGRLMLDLYAYGQIKEPSFIKAEATVNYIDCGLISISCKDFQILESKLLCACKDSFLREEHTESMRQKMINLILKCEKMEECFERNKVSLQVMYEGFDALTDVIACRRFADVASDLLISEIGIGCLNSLKLPSYLVLLQEAMKKIGYDSNDNQLKTFIWEYGYLAGFSVLENKFENIDYLKSFALMKEKVGEEIEKLNVEYEPPDCRTRNEKLFYDLSWFSECKHIYQLRVLRNLRKYMQLEGMDIVKTDARSLFKDVLEFKRYNV